MGIFKKDTKKATSKKKASPKKKAVETKKVEQVAPETISFSVKNIKD